MSGKIIDFRGHRDPRRARLARHKPAPDASIHQQIVRLALLLRDLEALAQAGEALPPGVLVEARASIEDTRRMLRSWPGATGKDDAQHDVDRELLEKMYRDLGLLP